jgi:hypothetical protein
VHRYVFAEGGQPVAVTALHITLARASLAPTRWARDREPPHVVKHRKSSPVYNLISHASTAQTGFRLQLTGRR